MQKVRLVVHTSDVDAALDVIQQAGALEFKPTVIDQAGELPQIKFPNAILLPKVQHAVRFLEPYGVKKGLWQSLREGSKIELTEVEVEKALRECDVAESIVSDLERLQVDFTDSTERIRALSEQERFFSAWESLPIKLTELETVRTRTFLFAFSSVSGGRTLSEVITELLEKQNFSYLVTAVTPLKVAVTIANEQESIVKLKRLAEEQGIETVTVPAGSDTPAVELVGVKKALKQATDELALLHDQAEHYAITHLKTLQTFSEVLQWQYDRFAALETAAATRFTVIFDGWLNAGKKAVIEARFQEKHVAAAFAALPLEEGEEPPVDIENSALIRPFEAVTRLYGMPGYTDLDPTVFLAGFFFLFFGLSLTDVGYGLALVLITGFALLFFRLDSGVRMFAQLLFYVGLATVFVGAVFGGYLGFDITTLPGWVQAIAYYNPIHEPLPVFYLALSLGVFQVMVGMVLKIYSEARNARLISGLLDQGPWLLMFAIGILYVLTSVEYVSVIPVENIGNLAIVAALLILLASGRTGKGVVGKCIAAVAGLYAGVGYFSDILSYSRLLALGLATSALAYAVNLIAGMVVGVPVVGIVLAGVILIIGHVFTLAINTLGAFVHSARLQFVEFFGKFIAGTGREFAPLKRKKKYLAVGDD
jgi:V/A-type H+-transporting ATPase subunit I